MGVVVVKNKDLFHKKAPKPHVHLLLVAFGIMNKVALEILWQESNEKRNVWDVHGYGWQ